MANLDYRLEWLGASEEAHLGCMWEALWYLHCVAMAEHPGWSSTPASVSCPSPSSDRKSSGVAEEHTSGLWELLCLISHKPDLSDALLLSRSRNCDKAVSSKRGRFSEEMRAHLGLRLELLLLKRGNKSLLEYEEYVSHLWFTPDKQLILLSLQYLWRSCLYPRPCVCWLCTKDQCCHTIFQEWQKEVVFNCQAY